LCCQNNRPRLSFQKAHLQSKESPLPHWQRAFLLCPSAERLPEPCLGQTFALHFTPTCMSTSADFIPEHTFDALLELDSENGGVYFLVPFSVEATYGKLGKLPVRVTIDGFPYQGPLTSLGDGTHCLVVNRTIRNAIDKTWGHTVHVLLALDTAPRVVEVPEDFAHALLVMPGAREKFTNLSFSHQREYVRWITGAKKEETRRKRLQEAVDMIAAGRKRG
jgi:hypothetical protein